MKRCGMPTLIVGAALLALVIVVALVVAIEAKLR